MKTLPPSLRGHDAVTARRRLALASLYEQFADALAKGWTPTRANRAEGGSHREQP